VLVTRLSAAEDAATMDTLCVDKTGTITRNSVSVVALLPAPGVTKAELLASAAMASDASDQDAIDGAILKAATDNGINSVLFQREKFTPFSPETRRTEAIVLKGSARYTVTKGSVSAITSWAVVDSNSSQASRDAEEQGRLGRRSIGVGESKENGPCRFLGLIALQDPPRVDSLPLVLKLQEMGIRVRMLTGDALPVAQAIASQIGLGSIVKETPDLERLAELLEKHDGLAEVYPETKFRAISALQAKGRIVGMTGDGVNDAPSLKKAEVGIAVSTATDAAKAAASVVLTTEGLGGIVDLIENGRAVYQRILTWMINKVSRTIFKTGFVVAAYFLTGRFVISAIAMLLVVLMMDFAKIALATDPVRISRRPDTWNVGPLALLGASLGVVMIVEGLILLEVAIHYLDLAVESPEIRTFTFLLLLFMALFSILSIRERHRFWSSRPGGWLLTALGLDAAIGVVVGVGGFFELPGLPGRLIIFAVTGAAIFSLILNDFVKHAYLSRIASPVPG
jgi:magnesium-transporting ATPase (P-type)